MFLLWLHSIPFLLRILPRADMESAPTVCQSRNILPAANFGGVGSPRPTSYLKKGNVGRPDLWPPCPFAPSCTIRAIAPHTPGTPRGTAPQRKASLVKGRWTPQADGGIPTGYALCAVTPADGQKSLRLAGSAPPFDKGGFSAPNLKLHFKFHSCKIWQSVLQSHSIPF